MLLLLVLLASGTLQVLAGGTAARAQTDEPEDPSYTTGSEGDNSPGVPDSEETGEGEDEEASQTEDERDPDGKPVCEEEHEHDDSCRPEEPAEEIICEEDHEHDDSCRGEELDEEEEPEPSEPTEHEHTGGCCEDDVPTPVPGPRPELAPQEYIYEDDETIVTVSLENAADIPAAAVLRVERITPENDAGKYTAMLEAISSQAVSEDQTISSVLLYDISFILAGEEVEPLNPVRVSIEYKESPAFEKEKVEHASDLLILHIVETEEAIEVEDVTYTLEDVENAEEGITALSFGAESFSTYAAVLLDTTVEARFYRQVSSIDSTASNYLIVSANGAYAFTADPNVRPKNATRVDMLPVKGNPGYFELGAGEVTDAMRFQFGAAGTLNGVATSIKSRNGFYINLFTSDLISTSVMNSHMTYFERSGSWRIGRPQNASFCLSNNGSGFSVNSNTNHTGTPEKYSNSLIAFKNVVIYKEVYTELYIPGDVSDSVSDPSGSTDPASPPAYAPYLNTSGAKTGEYKSSASKVSYASDAASSQIESVFTGDPGDDGKVWTDKSVVYGRDDYSAFPSGSYTDGTFGVSLSALAQQSQSQYESSYTAPMDVVFLIDTSASMKAVVNMERRAMTMVKALNNSINHIMGMNENNRVGVACFNDVAGSSVLPLDRYYVAANETAIPDYTGSGYTYFELQSGASEQFWVKNTAGLRSATGSRTQSAYFSNEVTGGTNTQHGLQKAYEVFTARSDTTVELPDGTVVKRMPLLILLSDGFPTYVTPNYTAPSMGPHYGSGSAETLSSSSSLMVYGGDGVNSKGVMGYYTVLSATYFKKMIGIHYGRTAKVGTIGIGISEYNPSNPYGSASGAGIGDDYARAVLNPTSANLGITGGNPASDRKVFGEQLSQLLSGSYSEKNVMVRNTADLDSNAEQNWPIGMSNILVPVIANPYSSGEYAYADYSFFGSSYNSEDLTNVFNGIVDVSVERKTVYTPPLQGNTSLVFEDKLGKGMELKGGFVLRYQGENYECSLVGSGANTQLYRVRDEVLVKNAVGEDVSLRDCLIIVTTAANGEQTVRWNVPDKLLPAYRKSATGSFYLEMLPIRLCYQVGPASADLLPGVYYTNAWRDGAGAYATFTPNSSNPYYAQGWENRPENIRYKAQNTTGTADTYFNAGGQGGSVKILLGNNGRLTVTEDKLSVSVEKRWFDSNGNADVSAGKPGVSVTLYRTVNAVNAASEPAPVEGNPCVLDGSNMWKHEWTELPPKDGTGASYIYYVVEEAVSGYDTSYSVNGGSATPERSENISDASGSVIIRNQARLYGSVTVVKEWLDASGNPLAHPDRLPEIEVTLMCRQGWLFPEFNPTDNFDEIIWLDTGKEVGSVKLSEKYGWQHTWDNLLKTESAAPDHEGSFYYYYYIEEKVPAGYKVTYSDNNILEVTEDSAGIQDGTITVTNKRVSHLVMPETGGPGIGGLILAGIVMTGLSIGYIVKIVYLKKGGKRQSL